MGEDIAQTFPRLPQGAFNRGRPIIYIARQTSQIGADELIGSYSMLRTRSRNWIRKPAMKGHRRSRFAANGLP